MVLCEDKKIFFKIIISHKLFREGCYEKKKNTMNENEDSMLVEWEELSFGHASPGKDVLQDAGRTDS